MLNKPLKLAPKTVKISRSGEISANLVTLQTSVLIDFDRQLNPDLREMFVFGCRRRRQQQKVAQNWFRKVFLKLEMEKWISQLGLLHIWRHLGHKFIPF